MSLKDIRLSTRHSVAQAPVQFLLTMVLAVVGAAGARAQTTFTWSQTGNLMFWNTATAWSPNGVPGPLDTVTETTTGLLQVNAGTAISVGTITAGVSSFGIASPTAGPAVSTLNVGTINMDTASITFKDSNESMGTILNVTVGTINMDAREVVFGRDVANQGLNSLSVGALNIGGGTILLNVQSDYSLGLITAAGTGSVIDLIQTAYTTAVSPRTVTVTGLAGTGGLTLDADADTSGKGANVTLNINGTGSYSSAAVLSDGSVAGKTLALTVNMAGGAQTLTGVSTFTGGTTISSGSLYASNASGSGLGTGAVTVQSGATLGGTGTIAPGAGNSVTVNGTLAAGDLGPSGAGAFTPGTLTFNLSGASQLIFGSGAHLAVTLGGSGANGMIAFTSPGNWLGGSGPVTLDITDGGSLQLATAYPILQNVTTASLPSSGLTVTYNGTALTAAQYAVTSDGTNLKIAILSKPAASPAPTIATQPASQTATPGGGATFTVVATGTGDTYQWSFNGAPISGAVNSALTLTNVQTANVGTYTVVATNSGGSVTSSGATLAVVAGGTAQITAQPVSVSVAAGHTASFSVTATGTGALSYQWYLNGAAIAGQTDRYLLVGNSSAANAGTYTCGVTDSTGLVLSAGATLSVVTTANPGRLINLSVLTMDGPGSQLLTLGFVTLGSGGGSQNLLIRGIGPALQAFSVANVLGDPELTVFSGQTSVGANDNWGTPAANQTAVTAADTATGAFTLPDPTSFDAALVTALTTNQSYTVQIAGKGAAAGNALAEVYDATPAGTYTVTGPRLINLSCLEQVSAGGTLTAGFTVGGGTSETVLIRVTGPALAAAPFNLAGTLADPTLTVFSGQTVIAANAGWAGDAQITAADTAVGAFALTTPASKDSAVLLTLAPGPYTVQGQSASGVLGTALIEIYEVP